MISRVIESSGRKSQSETSVQACSIRRHLPRTYVLLSEDMNCRTIARGIWPIQGVWLRPAAEPANRGACQGVTFIQFLFKVPSLDHWFFQIGERSSAAID
ncbi:hypothetical protein ACVITL_006361 [Rhizobium pisi]